MSTKIRSCITCHHRCICFKGLSESELETIENNRVVKDFLKEEIIIKQGSAASSICFIYSGKAKVFAEEKNRKLLIKINTETDMLGSETLFGKNIFSFSASAIEDTSVCMISNNVIMKMIMNNGVFAAEMVRRSNAMIIFLINRMYVISNKQMHGKVAEILLYLSKDVYKSNTFILTLSRKDIAEYIAMAMENVIRILREFHNDKIISISNKEITINSFPLLEKLKEIG
jgi:CRP/FNR family transcriptional regulator, polysaccharide utilization system transcription regulator